MFTFDYFLSSIRNDTPQIVSFPFLTGAEALRQQCAAQESHGYTGEKPPQDLALPVCWWGCLLLELLGARPG